MITPDRQKKVIAEDTDLGIGFLVAEADDGTYQPLGPVMTIREGREVAAADMRRRMFHLDQGSDPLCPARYLVWARGEGGYYVAVAEIETN